MPTPVRSSYLARRLCQQSQLWIRKPARLVGADKGAAISTDAARRAEDAIRGAIQAERGPPVRTRAGPQAFRRGAARGCLGEIPAARGRGSIALGSGETEREPSSAHG